MKKGQPLSVTRKEAVALGVVVFLVGGFLLALGNYLQNSSGAFSLGPSYYGGPIPPVRATGTISGHVQSGPFCPVQGPGCNEAALAAKWYGSERVVVDPGSPQETSVVLGSTGNYSVPVSAGAHQVTLSPKPLLPGRTKLPATVVVQVGKTTTWSPTFDTGVR